MAKSAEVLEFENDRVKVSRVTIGAGERRPRGARDDRVLVWLTEAHHVREEPNGKREVIKRKAGEVAWRPRSEHQIENLGTNTIEVIIVELKKRT
jgi:hypothetical protein